METNDPGVSDIGDPALLVGSVLAGRYRLTRLVAQGANTVIFDADDLDSRRAVTLKVVQPDLAASAAFRERFDATIRSVAALAHPNIAAVYDWGEVRLAGRPTNFVAVEQLRAGSLRDLYDRGRRLSPSQALAVGLDACRALDHAHRRGFVHAELTPSKLVFGDDRRLRLVDFGLASLVNESAWAEPSSVPTHVARYASPEQALSLPIDGTTDVYALCLVLVEGVTGQLPFAADSTVATLAARVGRLMPVSADLGPLAAVLERAGRPHADERSSAAEFGQALVQAAEKLPRPAPLPLLSSSLFETPLDQLRMPEDPTGGVARPGRPSDDAETAAPDDVVVVVTDHEPDSAALPAGDDAHLDAASEGAPEAAPGGSTGTASATDDPDGDESPATPIAVLDPGLVVASASTSTAPAAVVAPAVGPDGGLAHAAEAWVPDAEVPDAEVPADEVPDAEVPARARDVRRDDADVASTRETVAESDVPSSGRRRRWWRPLAALAVVAALAVLVVLAYRLFSTPSYDVPELAGLERAAALDLIDEFEWDVTVDLERSDDEPRPGRVVRTVPAFGERLARGEPFLLVVSEGPELRTLPELVGLNFVDAEARLTELALAPDIEEAHDEDVPRGGVVSWSVPDAPGVGAGGQVLPGTRVVVVASIGPAPRTVPDLTGLTAAAARTILDEERLELVEAEQVFDDEVPPGLIISQSPEAGTEVARDDRVTIVVSRGPDLVLLPDLGGLTLPEAQQALAEAGFVARLVLGASDGRFVSATIAGEPAEVGAPYRRGSQVDLVFL